MDFRLVYRKYFTRVLLCFAKVHAVRIPHKVLEQFVGILLLNNETGSLDDVTTILDEFTTPRRKLVLIH